jgi:hypothetical protein
MPAAPPTGCSGTRGMTWPDVIRRPEAASDSRNGDARRDAGREHSHARDTRWALSLSDLLTPWERTFCGDLAHRSGPLSGKQRACLDRILGKLRRTQGGAA